MVLRSWGYSENSNLAVYIVNRLLANFSYFIFVVLYQILDGNQCETYCSYHRPPSLVSTTDHIKVEFHIIRDQKVHKYESMTEMYGIFKAHYTFVAQEEYRRFYRHLYREKCGKFLASSNM